MNPYLVALLAFLGTWGAVAATVAVSVIRQYRRQRSLKNEIDSLPLSSVL